MRDMSGLDANVTLLDVGFALGAGGERAIVRVLPEIEVAMI